jgi:hypothetical protein
MEQTSSSINLDRLTKTNAKDQSFLLRYYSRLPIEFRVLMMQRHRKLLHTIKSSNTDVPIETISYAAMILSIKTLYSEEKKLSQKRFDDMSMEEIADLSLLHMKKFENRQPSPSPKRDKLIGYWAEVKQLKQMGKGFRYISNYLLTKRKFKVGHTLIQTTWKQLEKKNHE